MSKILLTTGNNTGLPDGTGLETFDVGDGGLGGYTAIVDPANPTRALKPAADGSLAVTNPAATSIDGKTPALGQALAAGSTPVVLTAAQLAALTPPAAITGFALDGTDISAPTAMPAGGVGIRGWLSAIWTKLNGTIGVSGTFWQATQPVSAVSLPLPTGASTSVKQPALGTAGTPSADFLSVQGAAGMTPVSVAPKMLVASDTFSRAANAIAYAAGDAVNSEPTLIANVTALHFAGITPASGRSEIQKVVLEITFGANTPVSVPAHRLHLFNISSMTKTLDNVAFIRKAADNGNYLKSIDIPAGVLEPGAGTDTVIGFDSNLAFLVKGDASGDLWGLLETLGAYNCTNAMGVKVGLEAKALN